MECINCHKEIEDAELGSHCPHCGWIIISITTNSGGLSKPYTYIAKMSESGAGCLLTLLGVRP